MRLVPHELIILKLRGRLPQLDRLDWVRKMTDDQCYAELRRLSGQDFGRDVNAWAKWFREQKGRERRKDEAALNRMTPAEHAAWLAKIEEADRLTLEAFRTWSAGKKTSQDQAAFEQSLRPLPRPSEVKPVDRATKRKPRPSR